MNLSNLCPTINAAPAPGKATTKGIGKTTFILLLTALAFGLLPNLAIAGPWDTAGEQVLAIFTGGLTRTIAIICIIALGIAALAGKLSWNWAVNITIGMVLIFGSVSIVDYLIAASGGG
ncbi:TrbC/VirB2 family protein [Noviherbaspirillum sp.]|uniref:TrbC/VirB2 family protein n=1 Tax=Noviherbaspirillum sp. TaxID=1926288 RepID=UPI002FE0C624